MAQINNPAQNHHILQLNNSNYQLITSMQSMRCPYNPQHILPQSSFIKHLGKCTAKNKHLFAQCVYNPYHVVQKAFLEKHYTQCQNAINDTQKPQELWVNEEQDWVTYKCVDSQHDATFGAKTDQQYDAAPSSNSIPTGTGEWKRVKEWTVEGQKIDEEKEKGSSGLK